MWWVLLLLTIISWSVTAMLAQKSKPQKDLQDKIIKEGSPKLKRLALCARIVSVGILIAFVWASRFAWHWLWLWCFHGILPLWMLTGAMVFGGVIVSFLLKEYWIISIDKENHRSYLCSRKTVHYVNGRSDHESL